jgi:hypothetical protein
VHYNTGALIMSKARIPAKTPTLEAYGELQTAYDHYNRALFQDQLPACLYATFLNPSSVCRKMPRSQVSAFMFSRPYT